MCTNKPVCWLYPGCGHSIAYFTRIVCLDFQAGAACSRGLRRGAIEPRTAHDSLCPQCVMRGWHKLEAANETRPE
jgi:hypothetical protein